jgi:hypothetical protein
MAKRITGSIVVVAALIACTPGPAETGDGDDGEQAGEGDGEGPVAACTATPSLLEVGGEAAGIGGPVAVDVQQQGGRVVLAMTPAGGARAHSAEFTLAGAAVDELVGAVTAEVGVVFAGEGSEYGYLRLTDERGIWFEGGRSTVIDGDAQGGGAIAAPFVLGAATGAHCRRGGSVFGYDVTLHEVAVLLDDAASTAGTPVVVDEDGVDGVWRGVDVRVVGVSADHGVDEEPPGTVDGLGPGSHEKTTIVGYLYRVRR